MGVSPWLPLALFTCLHAGIPSNASLMAVAGSAVQLICNVTGTVVWTKDGNPLMTSSRVVIGPQKQVFISNVQTSDEGEYRCDGGGRWNDTFLQVMGRWRLLVTIK